MAGRTPSWASNLVPCLMNVPAAAVASVMNSLRPLEWTPPDSGCSIAGRAAAFLARPSVQAELPLCDH